MALRSSKLQKAHQGLEVTPGTAVTANLLAPNTKLGLRFMGDPNEEYSAEGHLFPADSSSGLVWSGGAWEAPPTFDEAYLYYNSLFKHVAATSPGAGVAKKRVWSPSPAAADTHDTYSVERGQVGAIRKSTYVVYNSMKLLFGKRLRPLMSGDLLGQFDPAAGLTNAFSNGSPTVIKSSVIPKKAWNLYTADSFAELETDATLITPAAARFELDYGPVMKDAAFIGSAEPSWDALGIIVPNTSLKLTLPFDVSGSDLAGLLNMSKLDNSTPVFMRAVALGDELEEDIFETHQIDMCLRARVVPDDEDIDDVFLGLTWELGLFLDPTSGKAIEATLIGETA